MHPLEALARPYNEEMITFLRELVRTPSVNGHDDERAVAQLVLDRAAHLPGLRARSVARDERHPNVVVETGEGEPAFLFVAHLDTVAPGDEAAWSHPPFGAQVASGKLYGRGACDNKAGLVCGLYALVLAAQLQLTGRVVLAGVADEESGASSPLGMRYLLDEGLEAKGAIYGYPGSTVCIGHRGLLRLVITARGESVHAGSAEWSRGETGCNAVTGLAEALVEIERAGLRWDTPPHPSFPGLRCTVTPGTVMRGGTFESVVPGEATALVDVRLMPEQSSAGIVAHVTAILDQIAARRSRLRFSLKVKNDLPAAVIPADHWLPQLAVRHYELATGLKPLVQGAAPANEGYMLIGKGIPTLCGFGPEGGNAHAPNEYVVLESLALTAAIYAGIAQDVLQPSGGIA